MKPAAPARWEVIVGHCYFNYEEPAPALPASPYGSFTHRTVSKQRDAASAHEALELFQEVGYGRSDYATPDAAFACLRRMAGQLAFDGGRAIVVRFQLDRRWLAWRGEIHGVVAGRLEGRP